MPSRLLVVDDNEDNRDMLARRLQRRGYEVETAEDGASALARIEQEPFDLVILDIMMPGMSGLEVLERLRKTYPRAELPVLMATAKSDSQDMVRALSLGANDYVTKPIDFPVVLARIESHLQTRLQAPSIPAPVTTLPADGRATPGTVLGGRYEVEEILGEGGFAIVFRAKQLSTGQTVAVKVLRHRRGAAQAVDRKRFEREMRTIGRLRHPSVVRLIDFGTFEARVREEGAGWAESTGSAGVEETAGAAPRTVTRRLPYIVMEYVEGQTLGELLRHEGPLAASCAVELLLPVVSAVSAAHDLRVLHRDLKPPNIVVTQSQGRPEPKVLDFGIAKPLVDGDEGKGSIVTLGDGLLGTPEYMAPELLADSRHLDPKADQYALGCLLYECVVGQRAFRRATFVELVQAILAGDYPRPRERGVEVPEGLEAVIERAMDVDPERRFSSVRALGRALLPFATPAVQARWAPDFDVPTDPPPPPKERCSERSADELPTRDLQADARAVEPSASAGAARIGLLLFVLGAILAGAAAWIAAR